MEESNFPDDKAYETCEPQPVLQSAMWLNNIIDFLSIGRLYGDFSITFDWKKEHLFVDI